ncbi:hypothetical protein CPB84DRAFT_1782342 [Gymnopilus junonius]|uniref:C2H2-type domain-containing protein n=1 Tax=Gymnopilus junonius TaxID=109634 RepID=A0A9P5NIJ9_GYMJU|nr:hypothetical protein CPB84DRAFT_1782342 [Gymnopilus junonius]
MEQTANSATAMDTEEGWDEEEDYEEDDDADIDAEALEIARRLGEQLWADISKVTTEGNAAEAPAADGQAIVPRQENEQITPGSIAHAPRKEEAIITTMKSILSLVENDSQAKSALFSATIPSGPSIFDTLLQCSASGTIAKGIAGPLSQVIITLARSSVLFGNLKQSNASAIQLDKGKRKRDELDEGQYLHHPFKRPFIPDLELQNQVVEAVRVVSHALGISTPQSLDPSLVSSIRLQLHQIFLFSVTSAALAGPNMHALQEIGGLIQVIGVLSGIQIGHSPGSVPQANCQPFGQASYPWNQGQPSSTTTDIGTAVYPCLVAGCRKTFSRLYSLRAHQRSHSTHRPYRCGVCPASFARNHDLKRHIRLHEKKAWKCEGCHKIFSRRDAIKRHKTGTKNRGPRSEICLVAEVVEVDLEGEDAEDTIREERRAKMWNGIAVNEAIGSSVAVSQHAYKDAKAEEGEINPAIIAGIQGSVLGLHGILQVLVGDALGNPIGHPSSVPVDTAGQATLASVIARAQSQTSPSSTFISSVPSQMPPSHTGLDGAPTSHPTAEENSSEAQTHGENVENHQPLPSLSMYGLSDEQAQLLEIAIAKAASAAQAQAEAEAALEEEEEEDYDNEYDSEIEQDKEPVPQ